MADRRWVIGRLAQLCAVATCLFPERAEAQEFIPSAGFNLGFTLEKKAQVEWGFSVVGTRLENTIMHCDKRARDGYGGWFRFSMIGASSPRIGAGVHAGQQWDNSPFGHIGELGWILRTDELQMGLHTAALLQVFNGNAYARQQWFLDDYSLGVELRALPTFGPPADCDGYPSSVPGRPLRATDGSQIASASVRAAGDAPGGAAAQRWERESRDECASISAFLCLATDLLAAGAPTRLVEGALDAAEDEMVHAALCAAVATELGGVSTWPAMPPPARPPLRDPKAALRRLARESWFDGVLNEGEAAKRAALAAQGETDPLLCAVHQRIAADEARHAYLGLEVAGWALDRLFRQSG